MMLVGGKRKCGWVYFLFFCKLYFRLCVFLKLFLELLLHTPNAKIVFEKLSKSM